MRSDEEFWQLINAANQDFDGFCDRLNTMSKQDLKEFVWLFKDKAGELADDRFLDCILDNRDSITEDALEDLSGWIVGKGENFYKSVLESPEKIPAEINDDSPGITIQFEASRIYFEKFGEHVPES